MKSYSLCFVVLCYFVYVIDSDYVGKKCVINSSSLGECVPIYECQKAMIAFKSRPISKFARENLKKMHCGFDKFTPLVCCANDYANLEELSNEHQVTHEQFQSTSSTNLPYYYPTISKIPASERSDNSLLPERNVCGRGILHDKIFGGEETDIAEFPWMVLLGYRNGTGTTVFQCSGVLINKRYILTAAHCVTGEILTTIGRLDIVRVGEYDLQTNPDCVGPKGYEECAPPHQDIRVERSIPHKGFSSANRNRKDDIALVRLIREVEYMTFVQPICLPDSVNLRLADNDQGYVSGWGKTLKTKYSNVKIKLSLPIMEKTKCQSKFSTTKVTLGQGQFCAGGESNKDACRGDSGGPLMKEVEPGTWVTMGIVSFGYGCGLAGWPGVYTDVSKYLGWIHDNIKP